MKEYLGDSVYADSLPGVGIRLYTDNGYGAKNEIYLESEGFMALLKFVERAFGLTIVVKSVEDANG